MNQQVQQALGQLTEIDEIIREDSLKPRNPNEYDRFMSLVHQKEGLIDLIKETSGLTPYWTPDGYRLRQ